MHTSGFFLFAPSVDWEYLYKKYGFYIPGIYYLMTTDFVRNDL